MSNALADHLAPLPALDERGALVPLGPFWQAKAIVLGFVRHFG